MDNPLFYLYSLFLIMFIVVWLYISLRIWYFQKRLANLFRHILSGEYNAGIKIISFFDDEISILSRLANKSMEQLQEFDELRAERTGLSYRALDLLFRNVQEKVIIADMEKKVFRFNPAVQSLYQVNQEKFTFESIEKQDENTRFFRIFLLTTLRDGIIREDEATLQLPLRELKQKIAFKIIPVKGKDEKVTVAIIFIRESDTT